MAGRDPVGEFIDYVAEAIQWFDYQGPQRRRRPIADPVIARAMAEYILDAIDEYDGDQFVALPAPAEGSDDTREEGDRG